MHLHTHYQLMLSTGAFFNKFFRSLENKIICHSHGLASYCWRTERLEEAQALQAQILVLTGEETRLCRYSYMRPRSDSIPLVPEPYSPDAMAMWSQSTANILTGLVIKRPRSVFRKVP